MTGPMILPPVPSCSIRGGCDISARGSEADPDARSPVGIPKAAVALREDDVMIAGKVHLVSRICRGHRVNLNGRGRSLALGPSISLIALIPFLILYHSR